MKTIVVVRKGDVAVIAAGAEFATGTSLPIYVEQVKLK